MNPRRSPLAGGCLISVQENRNSLLIRSHKTRNRFKKMATSTGFEPPTSSLGRRHLRAAASPVEPKTSCHVPWNAAEYRCVCPKIGQIFFAGHSKGDTKTVHFKSTILPKTGRAAGNRKAWRPQMETRTVLPLVTVQSSVLLTDALHYVGVLCKLIGVMRELAGEPIAPNS